MRLAIMAPEEAGDDQEKSHYIDVMAQIVNLKWGINQELRILNFDLYTQELWFLLYEPFLQHRHQS